METEMVGADPVRRFYLDIDERLFRIWLPRLNRWSLEVHWPEGGLDAAVTPEFAEWLPDN